MNIHVADNAREAARMLLRNMLAVIRQPSGAGGEGDTVNVAFSGGSTPAILFDVWVEEFAELTPWNRFRVYWVLGTDFPDTRRARGCGKRSIALFFDGVVAVTIGRAHTRV